MEIEKDLKKISNDDFDAFYSKIDSEYFGISSAKVILNKPCLMEQNQDALIEFIHTFKFSVIINKKNHSSNNQWIGRKTNAFLVDFNIQFNKNLNIFNEEKCQRIEISDFFPKNHNIVKMAAISFKESRFLKDPNLPLGKSSLIYADIVNNAFEKPGRFFATYREKKEVLAFLLFSINKKNSNITIELIAVDENFLGRGLGQQLINTVANFAKEQEILNIVVGTQMENYSAIKFYIKLGFDMIECNSIYHYWPEK